MLSAGLYLAFMTVTDYRPDKAIRLDIKANQPALLKKNMPVSIAEKNRMEPPNREAIRPDRCREKPMRI